MTSDRPAWPGMVSSAFDAAAKAIGSDVYRMEVFVLEDGDLGVVFRADTGPEIFKLTDFGEGWQSMKGVAIISSGDHVFGLAAAEAIREYVTKERASGGEPVRPGEPGTQAPALNLAPPLAVSKCPCCDGWGKRADARGISSVACELVTCPACNGKCVVWA